MQDKNTIRILFIEDDEDDYVLIRDLLEDSEYMNFTVDWQADVGEALKALEKSDYDVYLIDFRLGEQNGLTVIEEAIENGCESPLILITGKGDSAIDFAAMKAGAFDYLTKENLTTELIERSIRYSIERKWTEQQLRQKEQFLRSVANTSPTFIYIHDLEENKNIYTNKSLFTLLGYQSDELKQMEDNILPKLIHPADWSIVEKSIAKLRDAEDDEVVESEYRMKHKSGEWRWYYNRAIVFKRTHEDRVSQIIGSVLDITRRKKAQEALEESLNMHRVISDLISDYVYSADVFEDGTIQTKWIVGAFEQITGYTFDEIIHKEGGYTSIVHSEDFQTIVEQTRQLIQNRSVIYEYRIFSKGGEVRWLKDYVKPVWDDREKRVVKIWGAVQDITRSKEFEEEREKLISDLQKALSEIKSLRGIIPICSSCKKIRNDRGYWQQVEVFVTEHSDAEFTHGLCPECAKKLYGDYYEEE
jgi:PAS domain S-box-containing protein